METTSFKNEEREKPLYYQKKNKIGYCSRGGEHIISCDNLFNHLCSLKRRTDADDLRPRFG